MKKTLLACALALTSLSALAVPPALQSATKSGVKIVQEFDAGAKMKGYVVQIGSKYDIVYGDPSDTYLISGQLTDATGKDLTAEHRDKFIPKPDFSKAYGMLENVPLKVKMNDNAKGRKVFILADANCIFCHFADKAFAPYAATGKVDVEVVYLNFLAPDSANKAAAMMLAKDPAKAHAEHVRLFKTPSHGITPLKEVPANVQDALNKARDVMEYIQAQGTPAIVYKDAKGVVQVVKGMPTLSMVADIVGLPAIKNTDPELERFNR